MPVDTQISLSAILFNTKKVIVLGIVGLFNFIVNKLLKPFIKEDLKISSFQLIFSLTFILVILLSLLFFHLPQIIEMKAAFVFYLFHKKTKLWSHMGVLHSS